MLKLHQWNAVLTHVREVGVVEANLDAVSDESARSYDDHVVGEVEPLAQKLTGDTDTGLAVHEIQPSTG